MSLTPPSDFWPPPLGLTINGILTASPPLAVAGTNLTIADASATSSGVVNTGVQVIAGAKQLNTSLALSDGHAVTEISNDTTLAGDSGAALTTEHAVKTYVDNSAVAPFVTAVTAPLNMVGTNMHIANASALASGVVSIGTQAIAGAKTFNDAVSIFNTLHFTDTVNSITCPPSSYLYLSESSGASLWLAANGDVALRTSAPDTAAVRLKTGSVGDDAFIATNLLNTSHRQLLCANTTIGDSSVTGSLQVTGSAGIKALTYCGDSIIFDKAVVDGIPSITTNIDGQSVLLGGGFSGASLQVDTGIAGGHLKLNVGNVSGSQLKVIDSGTATELVTISPTSMHINEPLMINSTASQIKLGTLISSPTIVASGSNTQINCGSGTLELNNTPGVYISSMTGSTSPLDGALRVNGGIGAAESVCAVTLQGISDVKTQLRLVYDHSNSTEITCGKYADLLVDHIGTAPTTTLAYNATPAHVFTPTGAAIASTMTVNSVPNTNAVYITNVYGNARIMIDDVGDCYIDTSRDLYINGIQMPVIVTQTVVHTLAGAAAGATCSFTYQRIGNQAFVRVTNLLTASVGAGAITLDAGSLIPLFYRPTADGSNQMLVINGATNANGRYVVHTTGAMEFFTDPNTTGFTGSGNIGWYECLLVWYKP